MRRGRADSWRHTMDHWIDGFINSSRSRSPTVKSVYGMRAYDSRILSIRSSHHTDSFCSEVKNGTTKSKFLNKCLQMSDPRELERSALYMDYAMHKGWVSENNPIDHLYFDELWKKSGLNQEQRILEIGFGAGSFLDWALMRGHKPTGIDILPEVLAATAARGHKVFRGPLHKDMFTIERFDIICAFDLFEHLTLQEIHQHIDDCIPLFEKSPKFLLRFPNGSSPLYCVHQNSDVTHKTILSLDLMNQILVEHNLVARALEIRPYPKEIAGKIRRAFAYFLRFMLSSLVGAAYFGKRINLDANLELLVTEKTVTN